MTIAEAGQEFSQSLVGGLGIKIRGSTAPPPVRDPVAISPHLTHLFDEIVVVRLEQFQHPVKTPSIEFLIRPLGRVLEYGMYQRLPLDIDLAADSLADDGLEDEKKRTIARSWNFFIPCLAALASQSPSTALN